MKTETIILASDHAGFELKEVIKKFLVKKRKKVLDLGTKNKTSVDYPYFAHLLSKKINKKKQFGILICGSGIGMSITANRFKGIRAALCRSTDDAKLARQHNNANILTLPGRQIDVDEAKNCFKIFINTRFDGGRHQKRVKKID